MSIVPDVALPAARRSSDDSIPWSIELRSRCMNTFFSVAAISLRTRWPWLSICTTGAGLPKLGRERRQRLDHAAERVADALRAELAQHAAHGVARRVPVGRVRRIGTVEHAQASLMCARSTIRKSAPCTASPLRPSVTALIVA